MAISSTRNTPFSLFDPFATQRINPGPPGGGPPGSFLEGRCPGTSHLATRVLLQFESSVASFSGQDILSRRRRLEETEAIQDA
jgi:hypothetical protein